MREVVPILGRPGSRPGPAVTWGRGREGGRGAGRKGPRWKWLVGNNKCTHWLLNAAHHILGNLENAPPCLLPPLHPHPRQKLAFMRLRRQHGGFDSDGLVSSTGQPSRAARLLANTFLF